MQTETSTPETTTQTTEKTTQTAAVPKKASTHCRPRILKIARYFIVLMLIMLLFAPSSIPFFPAAWASKIEETVGGVFSDVSALSDMLTFNWMALVQVAIMIVVLLFLREVLHWILQRCTPKTGRGETLKNLALSSLQYTVVTIGLLWGLAILGVNISTLFASVGIVALIVGFGAESLISDMVTGFFMIFENLYNVGDMIEIDGYRGTVTSIGLRTTSVTNDGGNAKIFNNSDMRNIVQLSNLNSYAVCDVPIAYEADLDLACETVSALLARFPEEYPDIFPCTPNLLGVQELGKFAVYLRVSASVAEAKRFTAARIMNKLLKIEMEKAGMGAPHGIPTR